jgi:hypothetical protein
VFENPRADTPEAVFQSREAKLSLIPNRPQMISFIEKSCYYFVVKHSCTLRAYFKENTVLTEEGNQQMQQNFFGFIIRVQIQAVVRGPKKRNIYSSTLVVLGSLAGIQCASHGRKYWGFNSPWIFFTITRS